MTNPFDPPPGRRTGTPAQLLAWDQEYERRRRAANPPVPLTPKQEAFHRRADKILSQEVLPDNLLEVLFGPALAEGIVNLIEEEESG
jgi:hypothetical protein